PDPADKSGKLYAVDVEPVKKLPSPVTLAAVKADRRFASFPLTRIPRLSVMPVSDDEWRAIVEMSKKS
ncbi:MAG: EVE domain-containing protein, partial [Acidobacteria bacterium]